MQGEKLMKNQDLMDLLMEFYLLYGERSFPFIKLKDINNPAVDQNKRHESIVEAMAQGFIIYEEQCNFSSNNQVKISEKGRQYCK